MDGSDLGTFVAFGDVEKPAVALLEVVPQQVTGEVPPTKVALVTLNIGFQDVAQEAK